MGLKPLLVVVTVAVMALCGCSNNPEVKESSGDNQASKPDAPELSSADMETFFEALASSDPDKLEAAIPLAAEGSVAEAYALYHLHTTNAGIDSGFPNPEETVTKSSKGFRVCSSPDEELAAGEKRCSIWSGIESEDGKIANLTVDGQELNDRISTGTGDKIKLGNLGTLEFLSAYQSVTSDAMFVQVLVNTKDLAVSASDFNSARYRAPNGRQSNATFAFTPDEISPDSSSYVSVVFDKAKPGGEMHVTLSDSDYNVEREVTIPTR